MKRYVPKYLISGINLYTCYLSDGVKRLSRSWKFAICYFRAAQQQR
jgi:hypothetical protein